MKETATKNQCDGCKAKMPLKGNIHIRPDGKSHMICEKARYPKNEKETKI